MTGGAGFIGSHLVKQLLDDDYHVTVVDRATNGEGFGKVAPDPRKLTTVAVDLLDVDISQFLTSVRPDVIFHLAGTSYVPHSVANPFIDFQNTLLTTVRLLEAIRECALDAPFILASSAAVYGNPRRLPIVENCETIPISPYGVSKLAAERYLSVYAQLYNVRGASLRYFSLYGPRQRKQIVYDFCQKLLASGNELEIIGDGQQRRDLIFIDDAVEATLRVLQRGSLRGEVYNIATGSSHSALEIAQEVAAVLKLTPKFKFLGASRPGDPTEWVADISRLRQLGFSPTIQLHEGLQRTVQWARCNRDR